MTTVALRQYTLREEIFSSVVHGVGTVFGVAALTVLVTLSSIYGSVWGIVASAVFGASIIVMYCASTIYHAIPFPNAKKVLKKFDHISIYYLIAGTYTPFLLVPLRGTTGWIVFGIIWGAAILGTILKLVLPVNGAKFWSIALYAGMGWAVVFVSKSLIEVLPTVSFVFLVLGGLFYTVGICFYLWKSKEFTHAIWHCFVLLGTIMHFLAILFSCIF